MKGRIQFPTLWVLISLGALSVCIQYVTMTKLWVLSPSQTYGTWGRFLSAVLEEPIIFGPLDALLAILFLLGAALLIYQEARHRVLTAFLQDCFASPGKTLWLLTASLFVCGRFYFARGEPSWAADAAHHLAHSWIAAQAIADGQVPIWTFYIGTGSPVFQTYGFVFFYLAGLVDLFLGDFYLSLKLILGAAHVLSGIGMYLLAASLCRSRAAGFIAGLAYALCFWHTQHVLLMGRLSLSLFYAFLPWAFYWIEQVVDGPRRMPAALLGGASLALLTLTHPGYGAFAMALAGCYSVVRLWSCWGCSDRVAILRLGDRAGVLHERGDVLRAWSYPHARLRHEPVRASRPQLAAPPELVELSLLAGSPRSPPLVRRLPGRLVVCHCHRRRRGRAET